jgi:hypothetical protein
VNIDVTETNIFQADYREIQVTKVGRLNEQDFI